MAMYGLYQSYKINRVLTRAEKKLSYIREEFDEKKR